MDVGEKRNGMDTPVHSTSKDAPHLRWFLSCVSIGQTKCNDAILDCCSLLGEPRHCLGIVASSRGYLAGRISIRGEVKRKMGLTRPRMAEAKRGHARYGSLWDLPVEDLEARHEHLRTFENSLPTTDTYLFEDVRPLLSHITYGAHV